MYSTRALLVLALTTTVASVSVAQSPSVPRIPLRPLPAASATSTDSIGSVAAVRQLPNGNVLVNDQARRRVVLLDPGMKVIGLVADSTSSTNNAYGVRPGGLIAYRGDSTLFIEPAGLSMLVIDPAGKIIRTMAAPRANDVNFLIGGALGNPGFDAKGRLVYRTIDFGMRGMRPPQPGQPFTMPTPPDSSALVRFDLATRKLDTVGFFKIPKSNVQMTQDANGGPRISITINPLPMVDEWAVMSDGTVAFVRGQDYHVDFVDGSGARTVAEKIPYEWQRLTDDDKARFIDSAKVAIEKTRAAAMANGGANQGNAIRDMMGFGGGGGATVVVAMTREGPGGPPGGAPGGGTRVETGGTPAGGGAQMPPINMVSPSELPDYKPVFGPGSIRADMDGRLWVRTIPTKPTTGGAIYDVIDRTGKLVDRVQVPAGSTIAGFGAGNVVYLGMRDATGLHLQRIVAK
ncbi:hypothetical protein BH11GEM1_BH11GEM1_23870 [soil metagenome]